MEPSPPLPPRTNPEPPSPGPMPEPPVPMANQIIQPTNSPSISDQPSPEPAGITTPDSAGVIPPSTSGEAIIGPEVYTTSPVVGANDAEIINTGTTPKTKKRFIKSPIFIALLVVLLLLAGSASAYFGYVLPNQPDRIWAKALSNTGKGYDKLSEYAQTQFSSKSKGVNVKGTYKISGIFAADGAFAGTTDGENGQFTASLSATGAKINLDTRIIKSDTGSPDVYFKLDGVKGLGTLIGALDPQYANAINGLDGTWYFVDHSLFDQLASGANTSLQISQSDIKSVLKAVGDASKQNVFTADGTKSVFVVKQNIGKEKQDDRSVYHYKVSVNKDNLKQYVKALCTNLGNSSLKKLYDNNSQSVTSTLGCDTVNASISKFDSARTADVWVDMHTKLIHTIRFTDPKNKNNYFEVGQDYQGGDELPFFIRSNSKDGDTINTSSLELNLNMKTNTLTVKGTTRDSGPSGSSATIQASVTPNNSDLKIEKPASAKTIIELLNDLGLNSFTDGSASINEKAQDTERKTDINALHGQLEAYYAQNGYYPTLAQLNNAAFRDQNMKGLDSAALTDPGSSSTVIVASPVAKSYSYSVTPAGCGNTDCTGYTLTATLDEGGVYLKQSLN